MSEYGTPASTETETHGADAPGWAAALAQIDAEIDELRALLARHRSATGAGGDDGPGDDADD